MSVTDSNSEKQGQNWWELYHLLQCYLVPQILPWPCHSPPPKHTAYFVCCQISKYYQKQGQVLLWIFLLDLQGIESTARRWDLGNVGRYSGCKRTPLFPLASRVVPQAFMLLDRLKEISMQYPSLKLVNRLGTRTRRFVRTRRDHWRTQQKRHRRSSTLDD